MFITLFCNKFVLLLHMYTYMYKNDLSFEVLNDNFYR